MHSKYVDEFIFLTQRNNKSTHNESFIRIDQEKENDEEYVLSVYRELVKHFGKTFKFKIQDRKETGGIGFVLFYHKI